jgi:hypothetical protein
VKKGLKIEQIKSQIIKNTLSPAIKVVIVMLVVTGIVYPLVLVVIGQKIHYVMKGVKYENPYKEERRISNRLLSMFHEMLKKSS